MNAARNVPAADGDEVGIGPRSTDRAAEEVQRAPSRSSENVSVDEVLRKWCAVVVVALAAEVDDTSSRVPMTAHGVMPESSAQDALETFKKSSRCREARLLLDSRVVDSCVRL